MQIVIHVTDRYRRQPAESSTFSAALNFGTLRGLLRIPLGERHLRKAVKEYTEHYHVERNHQGLDNELIEKLIDSPRMNTAIECRERLGGILNYYHRRAA